MPKEFFQLKREDTVNVVELTLPQSIDSKEFEHLNEAISQLFVDPGGDLWVLDLSRLSYMGSSALGLMVNIRQQIKSAGGHLVLCGLSPRLVQIFHTCCLEQLFTIVKTREEALRQLKRGRG
jgi:anti-anti-sigma factor